MSNSTNKSIADNEAARSHHLVDEKRLGRRSPDERDRQENDERGRRVERDVAREAKK